MVVLTTAFATCSGSMTSATVIPLWVLFLLTRSTGISIKLIYRQCALRDRVDYELFPLYFA